MHPEPPTATRGDGTAGVLETVSRLVAELLDDDEIASGDVTMETSFSDDLEMASILFVVLAERLTEIYGDRVDFVGWVADRDLDELMDLRVGELVEHIASCLT
jgi:acyl carrier protein